MFDPWPDEPDEASPESRWGNPERDLPSVPQVETREADVDPHTLRTFWASVVVANAAVFGVSLGLMLWYFRGEVLLGGGLLVVGVLAGARTYSYYREFKRDRPPGETAETSDETTERSGETTETLGENHAPAADADGGDDGNETALDADETGDTAERND